jgi:antirestriction protein ArdC
MTAKQARDLGGNVRRDARPSMSIYASSFRKAGAPGLLGETPSRLIRFLRHYTVYNADEIEGLPSYYNPRDVAPTLTLRSLRQKEIDAFFVAIPAEVREGGDRAYFHPLLDYVQMPKA